jgi:hypothetical protein
MKIQIVKRPSKKFIDIVCPWILDCPPPDVKRTA